MTENFSQARARKLLMLWTLRAHKSARAHYKQSAILTAGHKTVTILNAGLSIVILYFSTRRLDILHHKPEKAPNNSGVLNQEGQEPYYNSADIISFPKIDLIGILALFLVLTTIFQFILQWGQRRLQHKYAASEFSNLQRKAERYSLKETLEMGAIHNLNREYNHITKSYGMVHPAVWHSVGFETDYQISTIESQLRDITPPKAKGRPRKRTLYWRFVFWYCSVS